MLGSKNMRLPMITHLALHGIVAGYLNLPELLVHVMLNQPFLVGVVGSSISMGIKLCCSSMDKASTGQTIKKVRNVVSFHTNSQGNLNFLQKGWVGIILRQPPLIVIVAKSCCLVKGKSHKFFFITTNDDTTQP